MTISSTDSRIAYVGNGSATEFTFPYPLRAASHLKVYHDGVQQFAGYVVVNGTVTYTVPPAVGVQILFDRIVPLTQLSDYVENDPLPAATLEDDFDLLTMAIQQVQTGFENVLRVPTGEPVLPMTLPSRAARANKIFAFDEMGLPIALSALDQSATTVTPSPGGTPRFLADIFGDVLNVKDFGAVGDGFTDDTAAFQAALDFAVGNTQSQPIYVPASPGRYIITSTLSVTEPAVTGSITIYGANTMKSDIFFTGTGNLFEFNYGLGDSLNGSHLHMSRLRLGTDSETAGAAIRVSRETTGHVFPASVFEDIYIYQIPTGFWDYGVHTSNSTDQWFSRCYFMHFGPENIANLFVQNQTTGSSTFGLYLNGCSFNGGKYNVRITGQQESVYITDSSLVGGEECVSMEAAATTFGGAHVTISGCHMNSRRVTIYMNNWRAIFISSTDIYSGVGVLDEDGTNVFIQGAERLVITDNKIEHGAVAQERNFIALNNVNDFTIVGNVMVHATIAGITIAGSSLRGVITGNVIRAYPPIANGHAGIFNSAAVGNFVYSGNIFDFFLRGIEFSNNHNVVSGNLFSNLTTGIVSSVAQSNNMALNNSFNNVGVQFLGVMRREYVATATVDPPSLGTGNGGVELVIVAGVAFGDFIDVSAPYDLQGVMVTAHAQAPGVVALYFRNNTGGTVNLASGTWRFRVHN